MTNYSEWIFLEKLVRSLKGEIEAIKPRRSGTLLLETQILEEEVAQGRTLNDWYRVVDSYSRLRKEFAATNAAFSEVADRYSDMKSFWEATRTQQQGASDGTFWDTYEHGKRRQLERLLASTMECEDSILLNSGMSAVQIAITSADLRTGDVVLAHSRSYFETSELLAMEQSRLGIRIKRVDFTSPTAIASAVAYYQPKLIIAETCTNAPGCGVPNFGDPNNWSCYRLPLVIIDNSMLSQAITYPQLVDAVPACPLLVVESGIKYLTHDVSAGVCYGSLNLLSTVRKIARGTGQQLQGKALEFIRPGAVTALPYRLSLHSRQALRFMEQFADRSIEITTALTDLKNRTDPMASLVKAVGPGSLVFMAKFGGATIPLSEVVDTWVSSAQLKQLRLDVRAGFGWDTPTVRSYGGKFLNQSDAPEFVRLSVGIGPEEEAIGIAQCLLERI